MTVLVTGFGPFGVVSSNPSAALALRLGQEEEVYARVLDTSYVRAPRRLCQLIDQVSPTYVLSFGVSRREGVNLERTAQNRDDSPVPDEDGDVRKNAVIMPGHSDLKTACDVVALAAQLGLTVSDDAGGYVCNHLYYQGLRHLQGTPQAGRMLFVHIPAQGDFLPQAQAILAAVRQL